jgi:hypothetical protein
VPAHAAAPPLPGTSTEAVSCASCAGVHIGLAKQDKPFTRWLPGTHAASAAPAARDALECTTLPALASPRPHTPCQWNHMQCSSHRPALPCQRCRRALVPASACQAAARQAAARQAAAQHTYTYAGEPRHAVRWGRQQRLRACPLHASMTHFVVCSSSPEETNLWASIQPKHPLELATTWPAVARS